MKKNNKKACICKENGLILANLKTGKGKCPVCHGEKKLNKRLKRMSKMYKEEGGVNAKPKRR